MREKFLKNSNWIFAIVSLGILAFLAVAIHDVQTAQGVGLFLSIRANADDRILFDLAVDAAAILGMVLLVVVPCQILKYQEASSHLRFFVTFLAFMPTLSLADLVHLFVGNTIPEFNVALREGSVWKAFFEGAEFSVSLLQMVLPMFVLLLAMVCLNSDTGAVGAASAVMSAESNTAVSGRKVIKCWYIVVLIIGAVAEVGVFLFPNMAYLLCFIMAYVILLVMFDLWERMMLIYPGLEKWSWILFGGLGLRGIYRLLELMSAFKLQ